jgi:hypothetical protein
MFERKLFQKKFDQKRKPTNLFKKCLIANLFKKGLIENPEQRRDKPAQRFRHNGFGTTVSAQRFWRNRTYL